MKFFSNKKAIKFRQKVAFVLALIMVTEAFMPTLTFALTSGPSAPEFSSFEPVTTTNMVDEFSGDFTYNIPVLNIPGAAGGGYAMSLSYHSGESVESEASWVGYGWTLNPGSINRGKQGFADDTKNTHTYYNEVPKNWTVSTGVSVGNLEVVSFNFPVSVNSSIRYNNYRGFGYTAGAGISYGQGLVTLGYSVSDGSGSFSAQVNPAALLSNVKSKKDKKDAELKQQHKDGKIDEKALNEGLAQNRKDQTAKDRIKAKSLSKLSGYSSNYGMYALGDQQQPSTVTPYEGFSFNTNFNLQFNALPSSLGPQIGFTGNYNHQKNKPEIDRAAYGYLYSALAYGAIGKSGVMDYYSEREAMYNKRDRYMSIPFASADMYSVSGEGMGGAFRMYNSSIGHFRPGEAKSKTIIAQVAVDIGVGLEYGGGFNLGLGQQTLNVGGEDWGNAGPGNTTNYLFPGSPGTAKNDQTFFRFNNDLGGGVNYGGTSSPDETVKADVIVQSSVPGAKTCKPNLDASKFPLGLQSKIEVENGTVGRSGRASYIGFHTNQEMNITSPTTNRVYAYEKSSNNYNSAVISRGNYPEQIGEIATTNEDGNMYVYGLPVYVKNETNLQYDLQGADASDIEHNFRAKKNVGTYKSKIGEVDHGAYASTYLLTQITTPDYIDRLFDGPSDDDFGGYTKFEYIKKHNVDGSGGYHYRMPFNGLNYSRGELSDNSDDMGSYSSGNKDIAYLNQIVTKTHIAKFITTDRTDGVDALDDVSAAASFTGNGGKKLQKLDAIELYTNNNGVIGKLIKKILFKYDYSLTPGIPNSTTSQGKLTLKELWFEYDGVVTAKISPYKFSYTYPKNNTASAGTEVPYPSKYESFQNEYGDRIGVSAFVENPGYSPFAIDAWGNYQDKATGEGRFDNMQAGLNQGTPTDGFDPAAWQLKVIQLPSGGEIHVQYEQDDYLFVQDKRAECLVSLTASSGSEEYPSITGGRKDTYVLNTADIGVTSPSDLDDLAGLINARYSGDKIFFKFLYALIGTDPELSKCNSDYITGYVNFISANVVGSNVVINVGVIPGADYDLPRSICLDLVKKQKGGKLNLLGNCDADESGVSDNLSIPAMVEQLILKIGSSFFTQTTCCLEIKPELSYFKIPVLHPKRGGGLRVKRILMYDKNGIDTGKESLYGTEYFYQTEDGKSSGVATNETIALRDENPFVTFLPKRNEQNFLEKAVSGTDKEQFEGPIGESLMPSASVGYGRIVSKNIHSGKTNTGFVVNEFYTCYDYPFGMYYNNGATAGVANTGVEKEKDWMNLPAIVFNYNVSNVWASQGYRFILNSMHGQPKTVATYSGDFVGGSIVTYAKSSSTEYQYFQPGESVPLMRPDGTIDFNGQPGKDMEVAYEMKSVEDVTQDASIEIDFGVGVAGVIPLPQASLSPLVNYSESKLRTHVTSKVIRYPAIQKAVISSQDGIVHKTENLVFNGYTGKPVKTRTTDGYAGKDLQVSSPIHNGTFTSYSTPAYSQYKEMGQKAINERLNITPGVVTSPWANISINASLVAGEYFLNFAATPPATSVCNAMDDLVKGDLIKVTPSGAYFHVDEITGSSLEILPARLLNLPPSSFSIANVTNIEVIRSGRTNQLNTMAGGYITYGAEQTPAVIGPDPVIQAQWQSFVNALTAQLPSGGSVNLAAHPLVVANDVACTPLTGGIVDVTPLVGNAFSINIFNPTNYVANGDFSLVNSTCFSANPGRPFRYGCVNNWFEAFSGIPVDLSSGKAHVNSSWPSVSPGYSLSANGILQNGIILDPSKQYTISFLRQVLGGGGATGTLKAILANPSSSGLPLATSSPFPIGSPPGQIIFSSSYAPGSSGMITSLPFSPLPGNSQLYIYGQDPNSGGQGLHIDDIKINEVGDCVSDLYTNPSGTNYGHFGFDEAGTILFYSADNACHPQTVGCIKFCDKNPASKTLAKVITSNATTYACVWPYDMSSYTPVTSNVYESGAKGKWRPEESFVYKSTIVGGSKTATTERNYNDAGVYTMTFFNYKNVPFNNPNEWVKTTTVTKYSPNGEAIEEVDAIGIYSSAKFGYNGTVPYLVGQNTNNEHVQFQSFEKSYVASPGFVKMEDGVIIPSSTYHNPSFGNIAHSGKGSFVSSSTAVSLSLKQFSSNLHLLTSGLSCKVWVKDVSHSASPIKGLMLATSGGANIPFNFFKVAQTGEWTLYEAKIFGFGMGTNYIPKIENNMSTTIYMDDVRIQPLDAQVNTYVYDPATLRLITSFDDQHFGLYYQYNQEGKLVRKMIETEKGMKTITETQYHTPFVDRTP